MVDRYGKPTGSVMRQISASNKALESIAVLTGHWQPKSKVDHDVSGDLLSLMERIDGRSRGIESGGAPPLNRLISLDSGENEVSTGQDIDSDVAEEGMGDRENEV